MHSITMNWEYRSKISFFVWGKIMHANGLDMSLSIADIYGTITVEQSNSRKHLYRSFYKLSTVWHS